MAAFLIPGHQLGRSPEPDRKHRFMEKVRRALAEQRYSRRTCAAYADWIRRYIIFHGRRHPIDLDAEDVKAFLSGLATRQRVSASTQNQALDRTPRRRIGQRDGGWRFRRVRGHRRHQSPHSRVLRGNDLAGHASRGIGVGDDGGPERGQLGFGECRRRRFLGTSSCNFGGVAHAALGREGWRVVREALHY
jgi:hypothetical protein